MTKVVALALAAWFVLLATADAKLVFQRAGSKAIVVARNDGSHRHVIAHGFAPVVSPDGKWVSFFRWHRFGDSLHVVDTAGGKSRKLSGGALAMEPMPAVWSPDSQLLLASNGRDSALLFNIERRTKHGYGLRDDQLAGGAFSPDATRLVLAYGGSSREDATLHVVRIGEARRQTLWTGEFPVWGTRGIAASASPSEIRFARKPGVPPHVIAHSPGWPAAVSSDGRIILVAEGNEFVPNRALLVEPLTEHAHRLAQQFETVNGLSRDGRHVLGVIDGKVVDVTRAGRVRRLVNHAAEPSWNK